MLPPDGFFVRREKANVIPLSGELAKSRSLTGMPDQFVYESAQEGKDDAQGVRANRAVMMPPATARAERADHSAPPATKSSSLSESSLKTAAGGRQRLVSRRRRPSYWAIGFQRVVGGAVVFFAGTAIFP
jgi:hypothetical protein